MKRLVVTGSECTGKTTLARALADHYATACVPEFARDFVTQKGAPPESADVDQIARGQIAREDQQARAAGRLLIQDTDLLSTVVYSRHYYGHCPTWIDEALRRRAADLYLLAGIDVPWEADGDQRDRGHLREEMQALFRAALTSRGLHFVEVEGPHEERMQQAIAAIDELAAQRPRSLTIGSR